MKRLPFLLLLSLAVTSCTCNVEFNIFKKREVIKATCQEYKTSRPIRARD